MVKVLIYSSKEIYDNAPFNGRAEAHVIAYREDGYHYRIVKNRTSQYIPEQVTPFTLRRHIRIVENDEWERDMKSYNLKDNLKESYRNHPITTLMKNESTDV